MGSKAFNSKKTNDKVTKANKVKENKFKKSTSNDPDVLVTLTAGMKYKVPGKRQRVIIGSIVIGLNVLLVISVLVYFYNPAFQEFVYNFGRWAWLYKSNILIIRPDLVGSLEIGKYYYLKNKSKVWLRIFSRVLR